MKFFCAAATAAIGLLSFTAAPGAEGQTGVELTPFGAYRFGGSFKLADTDMNSELVDSGSYGLIMNLRHEANTQWEVLYSRQQSDAEFRDATNSISLFDVDMQVLQGGGTYQGEGDRIRPYLALTVGGTRIKTRANGATEKDTFWSGSIGVGLQIRPNEHIGLRLEARAYGTLMNSDTDLFCQTGPNQNICAIRIDGTMLKQFETLAGIVFRF